MFIMSCGSKGRVVALLMHLIAVVVVVLAVLMRVRVMLAMLHAVNDGAGGHEEQRLEEGVRDEVEGCGHPGADAQRGHHEAQLRNGSTRPARA